jgi:hypothetical protein
MVERIESLFPLLRGADWWVSSKAEDRYNCIAWVADVTTDWWWPVGADATHWPERVTRAVTVEAFREAFASLGLVVCAGEELEQDFEKIALFANDQGIPKHAARQLPEGNWTSKLGMMEDINHPLHALEGTLYGSVVLVMKRPRTVEGGKTAGGGAS